MAVDWVGVVRLFHIFAAALWLGAGVFFLTRIMPAVKAAGPGAMPFLVAHLRRGGNGVLFGPAGLVTVLAGLILYWQRGYHSDPFGDTGAILVTSGAILGIFVLMEGLAVLMPTERKMIAIVKGLGPQGPTPDQVSQLQGLGEKSGRVGTRSVILLALAMVLMLLRGVIY